MSYKDQELLAEAYVTEIFGFGAKPNMVDLKKVLDADEYSIVANTFKSTPKLREYLQACNMGSCLIDKNKIPKICSILKHEYEVSNKSELTDNIIDTHDILAHFNYYN